jgi:hypothetical protein
VAQRKRTGAVWGGSLTVRGIEKGLVFGGLLGVLILVALIARFMLGVPGHHH